MIKISFNKRDWDKVNNFFLTAPQKLDVAINKALKRTGEQMVIDSRRFAPVKKGNLRRSIQMHTGNRYVVVGTDLIYAPIHEFGGTITPKAKKVLAFKVNGKWVFAKKVVIQKYKGRGYMRPAFEEAKKFAKEKFSLEIGEAIKQ